MISVAVSTTSVAGLQGRAGRTPVTWRGQDSPNGRDLLVAMTTA
jgi:hypothetical protein